MNFKTTAILFGLLCGSLLAFFLSQHFGWRTPEEQSEFARWVLPSLNDKLKPVGNADIDKIVVERSAEKPERLEFVRKGAEWRMTAPKDVKTDTSAVDRLLDQVKTAEKQKYAHLEESLKEYGLAEPKTKVTLTGKKGEYILYVGEQGPGKDPTMYVASSDAPKTPAAINKSKIDRVFAAVDEFRSKDLLSGSALDLTGFKITGVGRKPMELEKPEGKEWKFKEPKLGDADKKAADELVQAVTGLRVEKEQDFVADGQVDWAKYGLTADKATLAITLQKKPADGKEPTTETLYIGGKNATPAALSAALVVGSAIHTFAVPSLPANTLKLHAYQSAKSTEEMTSYFAKLGSENYVVRLDASKLKALEKQPDELRSRDLVEIETAKTDAINLTANGETLRFRRSELKTDPAVGGVPAPANWDLYSERGKVKTHLSVVTDLIDELNKLELKDAQSFLDDAGKQREWFGTETIDLGLDKPQAEVAVWSEGVQRDKDGKPEGVGEPKLKDAVKDKPNIKLVFGRKDDKKGVVYVRRQVGDNPPTILAVPDPFVTSAAPPPSAFPGAQPQPPTEKSVSVTTKLTAGYLAFRDHVLPSFVPTSANKLTYIRNGLTYLLEREEKKDDKGIATSTWNLKQPVVGKSANIEMLLHMLAALSADQLVADKPSEADLKDKFGLADRPLVKAVVSAKEKDDKITEYTYTIGKATDPKGPKPNHFYARVEVKPTEGNAPESNQFVVMIPWILAQTIETELRDTTILPAEATAKPASLTLTWRKLDAEKKLQETRLELAATRTAPTAKEEWSVKALTRNGQDVKGELAKFDAAKVQQLFAPAFSSFEGSLSLNPLVTERFIVHSGPAEPAHGLDPANKENPAALVVEVKYDNQTSRTLTVGSRYERKEEATPGLRQPAYHFASASTVSNAVFFVSESAFKPLLEGFGYFKSPEKPQS